MDVSAKINLTKTDPFFTETINGAPLPEDTYLQFGLGADYTKYTEMRRDANVRRLLQRRRRSVVARAVIAGSRGGRARDRKAEQIARQIADMCGYDRMVNALLDTGQLVGFAVVQLDWELSSDRQFVVPRWRFVPQDRFTFHEHLPNRRDIPVCTDEDLDPVNEIVLVQGYELRLLTRRAVMRGERCPKGRFVVYTFDGNATPWGLGLGYSIYPWYLVKKEAMKHWLLQSDRAGSPPVIGNTPSTIREEDPTVQETLTHFDNFLKAISPSGNWARLPTGFTANIEEVLKNTSAEVQERLIERANSEMSFTVIGERLFSDKDHGSYGAASAQNRAIDDNIVDGDIDEIDPQLNEQFWKPVQELNYSRAQYVYVRRQTSADLSEDDAEKAADERLQRKMEHDERLEKMGLVLPPEKLKERYGDDYISVTDSDRPLLHVLGDDADKLLTFLSTTALSMSRDTIVATLTLVFGLKEEDAEKLAGKAIAEAEATDTDSIPTVSTAEAENVQATSLNGAQISSLVEIAQSISEGRLPLEVGIQIVRVSFPSIGEEQAKLMLTPSEGFDIAQSRPPSEETSQAPAEDRSRDGSAAFADPDILGEDELDAIANLDMETEEGIDNLATDMERSLEVYD